MIKVRNQRAYGIANAKLQRLEDMVFDLRRQEPSPDEGFQKLHADALTELENQAEAIRLSLKEYDELAEGRKKVIYITTLSSLPDVLIQARIARGWTHAMLAKVIGVTDKQVAADESGGYSRAAFPRLIAIADALGVVISGEAHMTPRDSRLFLASGDSIGYTH